MDFYAIRMSIKLILINLLALFIISTLVFAQNPQDPIDSEVDVNYFVLIATSGKSLNVRQHPSVLSPVVASLPNGAKVPFVAATSDAKNSTRTWFQIEYSKGNLGWVSSGYSRKIKEVKNEATSQVSNLGSNDLATGKDVKPIAEADKKALKNSLQSDDIVKEPVLEIEASSPPAEKKGLFERFFSRKTKKQNNNTPEKIKAKSAKPWSNITGFRSAKFGMQMEEVIKAIYQDFKIPDGNINITRHPTDQTMHLVATVERLLPNTGKSQVVYVFGYKSKRLTHVNITTGYPVDTNATRQQVIDSANLLGDHFFKKRYQDDDLVAHARLKDGSILIFRGKDQKGRMALLHLSNQQLNDNNKDNLKVSLRLSYFEKPGQPDIYQLPDTSQIKDGDF